MSLELDDLVVRPNSQYQPHEPTDRQHVANYCADQFREVLYGGAAGGGKSDWLLHAALRYVDHPGYSALILRRTFPQLSKADGLVERAREWLTGTAAKYKEGTRTWTFPSGATLEFGHMEHEKNKYDYQGAAYQFIGFDELTQFTETQYLYVGFSRARRLVDGVPLCTASASNPGGLGHNWVNARFGCGAGSVPEESRTKRIFVKAKLSDNPYLNQEEYSDSLKELDPITRARLLAGDWTVVEAGGFFESEWFKIIETAPPVQGLPVRYWDLASTKPRKDNPDPDWTRGCLLSRDGVEIIIRDYRSLRAEPAQVRTFVLQTAQLDGPETQIGIEMEGGSSGKGDALTFQTLLAGFPMRSDRVTGSKATRAVGLAHAAFNGNVSLVRGPWNAEFLGEAAAFGTESAHDDMIDAASGAYSMLAGSWGWEQLFKKGKAA